VRPRPLPWSIAVGLALVAAACSRSSQTSPSPSASPSSSSSATTPAETGCAPNAQGYAPAKWIAPHAPQKACSDAELSEYVADCLDPATAIPIHCEQFGANHAACATCLLPKDETNGAGAFLPRAGETELNVGGCIAILLGDSSDGGCGAREQAARECVTYACDACSDDATCAARAQQTACTTYEMETRRELAVAATCALDKGLADDVLRVGRVFCGGKLE